MGDTLRGNRGKKQHATAVHSGRIPGPNGTRIKTFTGWCKDCGWSGETRLSWSQADRDCDGHIIAMGDVLS